MCDVYDLYYNESCKCGDRYHCLALYVKVKVYSNKVLILEIYSYSNLANNIITELVSI